MAESIKNRMVHTGQAVHKVPALKVPGPFQGFINFVREQGVVGLAVGLILGVAAKTVVDSLVNNIFNPIIGMLTGGKDLSERYVCLSSEAGQCVNKLAWGQLVSDIVSFLIVAAVVYFVVKGLKLERMDRPAEKEAA
jgi:large conductance mechanosensitive channel